jgi:hypothetical protein
MTKLFKIEHNLETGEILEIELTGDELIEHQKTLTEANAALAAEKKKVADKEALCAKMGISMEEAKLLLS